MTWLRELLDVPLGALTAWSPGLGGLDARTREHLAERVATGCDATVAGWVHRTWLEFLGSEPVDEIGPLLDYVDACLEHDAPVDATVLAAALGDRLADALRATVAVARLQSAPERLLTDRSLREVPTALAGLPLLVPGVLAAVALRVATVVAPALPEPVIDAADSGDLTVHLVASSVPALLGNRITRTVLVWAPRPMVVAFALEDGGATLVIGRGRIDVERGVRDDANLVIDGGTEPLARHAAAALVRQLGTLNPTR